MSEGLPERLREFYINFFFFVFVFSFDRTLCHRNCHILSLCRYVKNIHVFLVGSGYYNDWHFLLFSYWLIDRTLCHTKYKIVTYSLFQKYPLGVVVERLVWPETDCVIFLCGGEGKFHVPSRVSRGPQSA